MKQKILFAVGVLLGLYVITVRSDPDGYLDPIQGSFIGQHLYVTNTLARRAITRIVVHGSFTASTNSWLKLNNGNGEYFIYTNPDNPPTNTIGWIDGQAAHQWERLGVVHVYVSSTTNATNYFEINTVERR